jgi:phosphoglycolate phosphatase
MGLALVVFDLDGTLIDSQIDLANSVNAMLRHLGRPEQPHAVIAGYIGDGVSMLVRRALGDPEGDLHDVEYVDGALTFFLDYYRVHKLDFTYVYAGNPRRMAFAPNGSPDQQTCPPFARDLRAL